MRTTASTTILIVVAACRSDAPPTWHDDTDSRWRELSVAKGIPGFTRMDGGKTNIRFQNAASDWETVPGQLPCAFSVPQVWADFGVVCVVV